MTSAPASRQSSFELLRIVAMLLVLVIHASFGALGFPTPADVMARPAGTSALVLSQSFSAVCVNVFVLLSGWFGIRTSAQRLAAYLFQVAFLVTPVSLFYAWRFWHAEGHSPLQALRMCYDDSAGWFVHAYLLLCLLAPALNAFCQSATPRGLRLTTLSLLLFALYCWLPGLEFSNGYSALFFIVLYLTGRCLRLHPGRLARIRGRWWLGLYVVCSLGSALLALGPVFLHAPEPLAAVMLLKASSYLSPTVVVGAVALLMAFARLQFQSRWVNRIAASAFAVYLLHAATPFLVHDYAPTVRRLAEAHAAPAFVGLTALYIAAVFAACVLVDQLRIAAWRLLSRRLTRG